METKVQSFFWSKSVEIYRQVFTVFKKDPMVWFPFILLAIIDFVALTALFLSHSEPFSHLFAPIIRTFWSERYLHYPENFVLLPKLFHWAHLVIATVIGVFVSGLVIKKIEGQVNDGSVISILDAGRTVLRRYFSIVLAWFISYGIFSTVLKFAMPYLVSSFWLHLVSSFLLSVFLQAIVVFLIPALLILDRGFFRNLWEGFLFGFKYLIPTMLLIAIPMFFVVMLSMLKMFHPYYVNVHPELVLYVLAFGIPIMALVDLVITSSATILFLKERKK